MEHKVTKCDDCPLCEVNEHYDVFCHHPNRNDEDRHLGKSTESFITPDSCPLNKEPITIIKE